MQSLLYGRLTHGHFWFVQGMVYFISHRSLWQPFLSRLGPYLTLSAGVVSAMFAFTYLPQLAVLVFVNGPFAVVSTVLLVLNESSAIINTISRGWMLQEPLLDTFDGTLVARNEMAIVQEGREIRSGSDPVKRLGRVLKNPFERFGPKAMIRYLMYLPLNFIPIVGTIAFVGLQGEYIRLLACHCHWADWDDIGRIRGRSVHERVRRKPAVMRFFIRALILGIVFPTEEVVTVAKKELGGQARGSVYFVSRADCIRFPHRRLMS